MHEIRDLQLLEEALLRFDTYINRPYLYDLSALPLSIPAIAGEISLLKISPFPITTNPLSFSYILNALSTFEQSIGYIICYDETGYTLYIGIKGKNISATMIQLLKAGITQAFSNVTITPIENSETLLNTIFDANLYSLLATARCIPISTTPSLMNAFTTLMNVSTPYTAFFLVEPYSRAFIQEELSEAYEIYQILSMFNQSNQNASNGIAKNSSTTITRNTINTTGESLNNSTGDSVSCNEGSYTNLSAATSIPCTTSQSINTSILKNFASATINANNRSNSNGTSSGVSHGYTHSTLSALNKTENTSISFTIENKRVKDALAQLAPYIIRLQYLLNAPALAFNAYFFSSCAATSLQAAYNFAGLCQNDPDITNPIMVNTWDPSNPNYDKLFDSLKQFTHPCFCIKQDCTSGTVIINSSEYTYCIYQTS